MGKDIPTRICPYCKAEFVPSRKNKIYCKASCRDRQSAKRTGSKKRRRDSNQRPWLKHKKDFCEFCGFVAKHPCQLDVDHIDGDKSNNDPQNYQTLCANCHRLKTYLNKDWENKTPILT